MERLEALGVVAFIGHDPAQVGDAELVTASTAVPATNVELVAAAARGIPVLRRSEVLAAICATRHTIAVAGTHGKTTTSSMLALIMSDAGLRPSFVIGGDINEVGAGGSWDPAGRWLIVEADESDGTFLELAAPAVLVTSVEPDHLDFYGDVGHMEAAYQSFVSAAPGTRVVCADDAGAARLVSAVTSAVGGGAPEVVTYGTAPGATTGWWMWSPSGPRRRSTWSRAAPASGGRPRRPRPAQRPQRHGRAGDGLSVGADFATAARALARYAGVARRFEFRGERDGVTYVDDYGHLPSEVAAVLAAARAGDWERGRRRLPAPPLLPHRRPLARLRRRLRRRRHRDGHRRLRVR